MGCLVHLVGSVGFDTVPEVFERAGTLLGTHLKRVPDGEPGGRRMWTGWQYPVFRANPYLRVDADAPRKRNGFVPLGLAPGITAQDIRFGELGYAREARASYLDFVAARERGTLAPDVRFQVCLPTPFAVVDVAVTSEAAPAVEPAYEQAMLREINAMCAAIPLGDLCLQWDICPEMLLWDGRSGRPRPADLEGMLRANIRRQSAVVPAEVELGYHLCYGDFDGQHWIEPLDMTKLVDMANLIVESAAHPIAYIHMPVPIARDDDAYFAPMRGLKLGGGTELYLGLVHAADGVEGARRRIQRAQTYVENFGIASECGIARAKTPSVVEDLLRIHAETAR